MKWHLLWLVSIIASQTVTAGDSTGTRGGGDSCVQDFISVGRGLVFEVERVPQFIGYISPQKLSLALESAQVVCGSEPLILDGVEKDAINEPAKKLISVNRARWESIPTYLGRSALVLHELLALMNVDDSKYQWSSHFQRPQLSFAGVKSVLYGGDMGVFDNAQLVCEIDDLQKILTIYPKEKKIILSDRPTMPDGSERSPSVIEKVEFRLTTLDELSAGKNENALNVVGTYVKGYHKNREGGFQMITTNAVQPSEDSEDEEWKAYGTVSYFGKEHGIVSFQFEMNCRTIQLPAQ